MKCYLCGRLEGHHLGCPNKVERPNHTQIEPIERKEILNPEDDFSWTRPARLRSYDKTRTPAPYSKIIRTFLPLSLAAGTTIAIGEKGSLGGIPQVTCRSKHIWIAHIIADCFLIHDVFIGIKSMFAGVGKVPASLFRTGVWPLPKPEDIKEYGIDLSSWPTMMPGQRFSLIVENISGSSLPCYGALEVDAIDT